MAIIIKPKDIYGSPPHKLLIDNSVYGIEYEENQVGFENIVIGKSVEMIPYLKTGNTSTSYESVLNNENFNPISYNLGYEERQLSATQTARFLTCNMNIETKDYLYAKNFDILFESITDSWNIGNPTSGFQNNLDQVGRWKNSTFVKSVTYNYLNGNVNVQTVGPIIYIRETQYSPNFYMYAKSVTINVVADAVMQHSESKKYPDSLARPNHKLISSELLQRETKVGTQTIGVNNSSLIISKYGNGKETISMRCQYSEYYDEQGNLVLSIKENDKRMSFRIGDIVIPYKPTATGGTIPYGTNLDGTPKRYRVTELKEQQTGVCMQEITCQEET